MKTFAISAIVALTVLGFATAAIAGERVPTTGWASHFVTQSGVVETSGICLGKVCVGGAHGG